MEVTVDIISSGEDIALCGGRPEPGDIEGHCCFVMLCALVDTNLFDENAASLFRVKEPNQSSLLLQHTA